MTQAASAIIVAVKPSMECVMPRMSMRLSNARYSADPEVSRPAEASGLDHVGACAVLVHVSRMTRRCAAPSGSAAGLADGRLWSAGPGETESVGRPSSEVSRADMDGVRIRPWACRQNARSVRTHDGQPQAFT